MNTETPPNTCKFCGRECVAEFCSSYHKGRYTLIHKFDEPPAPEKSSHYSQRPRKRSDMTSTLRRMRYGQ